MKNLFSLQPDFLVSCRYRFGRLGRHLGLLLALVAAPAGLRAAAGDLREPENPANTTAGLDYAYYEGNFTSVSNFGGFMPVRTGTTVDFNLAARLRDDLFAFRYTGYLRVPADGTYTFYTNSDDGSQLSIGSTLVVDNDGLHTAQELSGQISLKAGLHAITVTFFEHDAEQQLSVSYAGPGLAKMTIPASALRRLDAPVPLRPADAVTSQLPGLSYSYYEGSYDNLPDFAALTPAASGTVSSFSLVPRQHDDNFAFRYTGFVQVPADGLYTFSLTSDDGSQLFIGSSLVVNNDGRHTSEEATGNIGLRAGLHAITVTFFEQVGQQALEVSYAGPGLDKVDIPAGALFRGTLVTAQKETAAARRENVQLFPNPAQSQVTLRLQAAQAETVQLEVLDALARRVAGTTFRAAAGQNDVPLALGALPAGVYTLAVQRAAGRTVRRLVVAP